MNDENVNQKEEAVEEELSTTDAIDEVAVVEEVTPDEQAEDEALPESTEREGESESTVNYEELMQKDLSELKGEFKELAGIESITELKNPLRYAALRDMGLSATEAYLATAGKSRGVDNRSHLFGSAPRTAGSPPSSMSRQELESAREIFHGMTDAQIQHLYRKVTR